MFLFDGFCPFPKVLGKILRVRILGHCYSLLPFISFADSSMEVPCGFSSVGPSFLPPGPGLSPPRPRGKQCVTVPLPSKASHVGQLGPSGS